MLKSILRRSCAAACVFVLILAGLSLVDNELPVVGQAVGKVKDGLSKYKRGDYEGAIQAFDEALATRPTDDDAKKMRDEIGAEMARDFISNNLADPGLRGRYTRFGKWLLAGRKRTSLTTREHNPEEIRTAVHEYMNDGHIGRTLQRGIQIRDRYGDFAVPEIQSKFMHADNVEYRARSRRLLATLGAQAVNAIVQAMYSDKMLDRQTAALALGDIGDARALPVLAKHFQSSGEDAQVKEACRRGIQTIRENFPERDRKVDTDKDLWYLQAESYYRNNAAGRYYRNRLVGATYAGNLPVLMFGYDRSYTVWKWIGDALISQEVPLWTYADILAEESAIEAMELGIKRAGGNADRNAFVQDAEALLACIHVHMYTEGVGRYYNGDDDERDFIVSYLGERGMAPFMHGLGLASSAGSPRLYAALERSLGDGYPEVSVSLCDAIASAGDESAIGKDLKKSPAAALFAALSANDKRIRYAAARALVKLGAAKTFGNNPMVESVILRNLQETSARAVLVIAEDEGLRNRYLSDLESLGITAVGAATLEDGARMAVQAPVFDAILLQADLALAPTAYYEPAKDAFGHESNVRMETIFDLLRDDVRTAQIPILVLCRVDDLDGRKTALAPRINDETFTDDSFLTHTEEYGTDSAALKDTLKSFWDRNPENAKARSNRLVVEMAEALADLDPAATKFNVKRLLTALSGGLRLMGRSSDAREAICRAIGVLVGSKGSVGSGWVRQNVIPNLLDTMNSVDEVDRPRVKGSAAWAAGECYKQHKGSYDQSGFDALLKMLRLEVDLGEIQDSDRRERAIRELAEARNAAGGALAKAPTTAVQRLKVVKAQAVNPHLPHPDRRTASE